jgi:hypothetical protein
MVIIFRVTYGIPLETKVADPQLGPVVDLAHWIQDRTTRSPRTQHRLIHDRWQITSFFEWLIETGQWHD